MMPRRTGRRRVNEALAVVSPLAFADAVEAYVTGLPNDDVRTLVQRSIKRMDSSERLQFAFFLGHDVASAAGADDVFSRPTVRAEEVQRLVDSSDDFLPNRFAAFLRENPRAMPALPDEALGDILAALPLTQSEAQALSEAAQPRRIPLRGVLVFALAVLIAVVPLAAQYIRQRGMMAETVNPPVVPMLPSMQAVGHGAKTPPQKASYARAAHRTIAQKPHVPNAAPKHVVAFAPARIHHHARVASTEGSTHQKVRRVAKAWKFDPKYNPYFNHKGFARSAQVAAASPRLAPTKQPASPMSPFEARARLVVSSYLSAVIAGNTPRALKHLGLPAGADPKAISESNIVSRDARANIVAVKPGDDGTTHVQVDIVGRRGEYFEVFSVLPDGPAVRIKDRFYIPVNRTAEEISARLLASKPR